MATGGEEKVRYSLAKVGTLTLETTDKFPDYCISIVVCQDKIVALDFKTDKVQIHRLQDGKFLASSDRLESWPRDMCPIDAITICVLHDDGLITMMAIHSTDMSRDIKTTRTLRLEGVMDEYHGVVRLNDSLVVSGIRQGTMYWCVASLDDGHVDTIHRICEGYGWSRMTTKDNMIYVLCNAGYEFPDNTGVYGFDILNPSQCKYTYKHQRLQDPTSIVINEDRNIFVCNRGFPGFCIHQLTASCQLVAIFTRGIPQGLRAIFWDNGRLYATCYKSSDITVFRHVHRVGSHTDSEEQGNVDKGHSSVKTEMPQSGSSHDDSESGRTPEDSESGPALEDSKSGPAPEDFDSGPTPKDSESGSALEDPESGPAPEDFETGPASEDSESGPAPEESESGPAPEDFESGPAPEDSESGPAPVDSESGPALEDSESGPAPEDSESGPAPEDFESGPAPEDSESGPAPEESESGPAPEDYESRPAPEDSESGPAPEDSGSGPAPEDSEDEKQDHKASEVLTSDEGNTAIEETSTQIVQEIPIEQIVEESLNQAGIQMTPEDRDLFLRFQGEIGTTLHFSKGPHTSIDCQESLEATETFIQDSHPDMKDKWLEYRNQGKLTPELIDVIYAKDRNPELHDNKDAILRQMEELNVIVKARSFDENGVKVENYFLTPCMLPQESPKDIIHPQPDPCMVSTSILCYVFKGKFLPPTIFDRLLAACVAHWPVAKNNETSDNLLFCGCAVFDLDLFHRMTLHCKDHVVFVRITRMVINDLKIPDAKLCTRVRKFITLNLSKITSCLDQNLQYEIRVHCQESRDVPEDRFHFSPPFQMWLADEVHDPDAPITREHMNHARLCVGLVTVCGNAMRDVLLTQVPAPHTNIYQAILASKTNLTRKQGRPLLNQDQSQLVFPDPKGRYTATVEQFDLSLLYTLIRNVSTVPVPSTGWGNDPQDQPRDTSLGASVERIRSYRNHIIGHSSTMEISQNDFDDYWTKFDTVLQDIEYTIGAQGYRVQLEKQKRQVISVYEAC